MEKISRKRWGIVGLLAVIACLVSGCVTSQQGIYLENQLREVQNKQAALEEKISANHQEFEQMLVQARSDVEQIRGVLNDATKLMQRNSADFGSEFERYQQDFATLRGKVETLNFNLDKMQKDFALFKEDVDLRFSSQPAGHAENSGSSFGSYGVEPRGEVVTSKTVRQVEYQLNEDAKPKSEVTVVANPRVRDSGKVSVGMDPVAILTTADNFKAAGKLPQAKELYNEVITTFPDEKDILPRAIFGLGEVLLQQKEAREAGKQFEKILSDYKNSDYLDDAYYRLGDVFVELGSCRNAAKFYNRVIQKFRSSPLVSKAEGRLKLIDNKQLCRD